MKVKLKFKNSREALALMELCKVDTVNNSWQKLLDYILSDLRIRISLLITKKTWMQQTIKGTISINCSELTAIYLNYDQGKAADLVRAMYDLQITPHLHILTIKNHEH